LNRGDRSWFKDRNHWFYAPYGWTVCDRQSRKKLFEMRTTQLDFSRRLAVDANATIVVVNEGAPLAGFVAHDLF